MMALERTGVHSDIWGRLRNCRTYSSNIIRQLFTPKTRQHSPTTGYGLTYNSKQIEDVYWDDSNKLVERL